MNMKNLVKSSYSIGLYDQPIANLPKITMTLSIRFYWVLVDSREFSHHLIWSYQYNLWAIFTEDCMMCKNKNYTYHIQLYPQILAFSWQKETCIEKHLSFGSCLVFSLYYSSLQLLVLGYIKINIKIISKNSTLFSPLLGYMLVLKEKKIPVFNLGFQFPEIWKKKKLCVSELYLIT